MFTSRYYATIAMIAFIPAVAVAADLPIGGSIVHGTGSMNQSGNALTITQNTDKLVTNWQSFSIGQGHTVNFQQPSADSVALNRVLGSDVSVIQGSLNANGKVFLVNPNGVTFGQGAQVNTGNLAASTLDIKTEDFMAGNYVFSGNSGNAVINRGNIQVAPGGTIALIAAKIVNEGSLVAQQGNVVLGAGKTVTLDLGGPVKLEVTEGALNTLIEQGGAIRADGGRVYLTAKAAGSLATSVINHTGITEAQTLSTGQKGEIILLGDMATGMTNVSGRLDASAPSSGDGGFIETSAAHVNIAEGTQITAGATSGRGGSWLIDPYDYVIDAVAAGNITNALNTGTNVAVTTFANNTSYGAGGPNNVNGDISVNSQIHKTAGGDATLSLIAANNIILNAEIKSSHNKLNLLLDADNDNGVRNGGGVTVANRGVSLNGGNLDFGTGTTMSINGVNTMVGGDLYIGGNSQVVLATGGGNLNLYGQLIIANNYGGVKFATSNGNATLHGIINSGNAYQKVAAASGDYFTWDEAFVDAKNGSLGGSAIGDSYLATVTSRLENALVVYAGEFPLPVGDNIIDLSNGAWIGGKRINNGPVWHWVSGPEGEANGGLGLAFSDSSAGGASVNGQFVAWRPGEPNGGSGAGGEDHLQIGDAQGRWNDLPADDANVHMRNYIREINLAASDFEIDAGTGTVSILGQIGGLKPINFISYDVSNPKPVPPVTLPPITRQVAVANAQATASKVAVQVVPVAMGNKPTAAKVGSMEMVALSSTDLQSMDNGDAKAPAGTQTTQPEVTGPTKVFVVDGGVRLPEHSDKEGK